MPFCWHDAWMQFWSVTRQDCILSWTYGIDARLNVVPASKLCIIMTKEHEALRQHAALKGLISKTLCDTSRCYLVRAVCIRWYITYYEAPRSVQNKAGDKAVRSDKSSSCVPWSAATLTPCVGDKRYNEWCIILPPGCLFIIIRKKSVWIFLSTVPNRSLHMGRSQYQIYILWYWYYGT